MRRRPEKLPADSDKISLFDFFISMLKIDSRYSNTDRHEILDTVSSYLTTHNVENQIYGGPENRTLVANINSIRPGKKGLILFSHADTAGWDDNWTCHPLSGKTLNNKIYGRGALDCKSLVAVHCAVIASIAQSGYEPDRDLCIIVTTDEESGFSRGASLAAKKHKLNERFDYALGEGGGYHIDTLSGPYLTCQVGEKGLYRFNERAMANGEHVVKSPGIGGSVEYLFKTISMKLFEATFRGCRMKPDLVNHFFSTFRNIDGNCNLSYLPGHNPVRLTKTLVNKNIIHAGAGGESIYKPFISRKTNLYKCINHYAGKYGWKKIIPVITRGSSDSRVFRNEGINTYGFFPVGKRENIMAIHKSDEHIHSDSLYEAFSITCDITTRLIFS